MNDIQKLDKEIQSLAAQIEAMENKKWKLEDRKIAIERQNLKDKVKEVFHEGGLYVVWRDIYENPYHCDLFSVYEILIRSQSGFKVRSFNFHYSDREVWTRIEKEHIDDAKLMDIIKAERVQTLESVGYNSIDQILNELALNPDKAEDWFVKHKPESIRW